MLFFSSEPWILFFTSASCRFGSGTTHDLHSGRHVVYLRKTYFLSKSTGKGVYFSRTCFHDANDCRHVMVTCPYNEDPLTPNIYIGKLGFTGVYIIFLNLL